jgi:hypothetical protein
VKYNKDNNTCDIQIKVSIKILATLKSQKDIENDNDKPIIIGLSGHILDKINEYGPSTGPSIKEAAIRHEVGHATAFFEDFPAEKIAKHLEENVEDFSDDSVSKLIKVLVGIEISPIFNENHLIKSNKKANHFEKEYFDTHEKWKPLDKNNSLYEDKYKLGMWRLE